MNRAYLVELDIIRRMDIGGEFCVPIHVVLEGHVVPVELQALDEERAGEPHPNKILHQAVEVGPKDCLGVINVQDWPIANVDAS